MEGGATQANKARKLPTELSQINEYSLVASGTRPAHGARALIINIIRHRSRRAHAIGILAAAASTLLYYGAGHGRVTDLD